MLSRTSRKLTHAMADAFTYSQVRYDARLAAWNAVDARLLKLENQVRKLKTQRDKVKLQAGRYASQVLELEDEIQRATEPL